MSWVTNLHSLKWWHCNFTSEINYMLTMKIRLKLKEKIVAHAIIIVT